MRSTPTLSVQIVEYEMLTGEIIRMTARLVFLGLATVDHGTAAAQEPRHARETGSQAAVPPSVAAEHEHLHDELAKVIKAGGRTAAEGRNVEKLLRPHFVKEEQFALPPLTALSTLAAGKMPSNAAEIIKMSDSLRNEMPVMLAEHEAIAKALERLRTTAREERKQEAAMFAEHLKAHARQEEEILYPAAVIAGQYLKLKQR